MNLFKRTDPDDAGAEQARREGAYVQGQRDARATVVTRAPISERAMLQERDTVARQAYDRGRRDERARRPRRHGSPLLTLLVLLIAGAGAFAIYLGVHEGSFTRGGQVVDQSLNNTTSTATQATRSVADKAGDALRNAGDHIKQTAGNGG